MFRGIGEARLAIKGSPPRLVRRVGPFWRKQIDLDRVTRVIAENVDALTHDCLQLTLVAGDGRVLQISEFDRDFQGVVAQLTTRFPGIERFAEATPKVPLTYTKITVWVAPSELSS